jgi:hypothetical protein
MLRTIILITRGILLDPRSRRWGMFVLLLAALVMLFAGSTFLAGSITTPMDFLIYWGICAWLTLAALLLALWDMLLLRIEARRVRRELQKKILEEKHDEP